MLARIIEINPWIFCATLFITAFIISTNITIIYHYFET